ncbi:MAG: LytR/AlgR family response regulator transcription factor [Salibacteraceae bacterium]
MKVLIIEDEPHAQAELQRLLAKVEPTIEVIDCIDSVEEAIEWLNENPQPEAMFLDIQLSDGISFEIFDHCKVEAPVIFTTAFDEYAIRAFQLNSIDYLLKPVEEAALQKALDKLQRWKGSSSETPVSSSTFFSEAQLRQLRELQKPSYKTRFIAKVGDQIKHMGVGEVAYFYADDNLVYLVTHQKKRVIIDYKLEQLETMLNPQAFFRLNRTFMAHIDSIGKVSRHFNSRLKVELVPEVDQDILISRVKAPKFMAWMDQ